MKGRFAACLVVLVSAGAVTSSGATRLTYDIRGEVRPIEWQSAPIQVLVDTTALTDSAAIERAFSRWERVERGNVRFSPGTTGKVRPGADGRSVITTTDGLFSSSGFLAFTTAWFDDQGTITEADIQIDRELAKRGLEPLLTHELGHLLGLDHSGVMSSAMYPFVSVDELVELESDDQTAMRQIYPAAGAKPDGAWLEGTVENSHSPIWGAQAVVVDELGHVHATALTDRNGRYRLGPLESGRYQVYVEPMDGPVGRRNFSGDWLGIPGVPFNTTFAFSEPLSLDEGETRDVNVRVIEAPVFLNPKWVGLVDPRAGELNLDSMPVRVKAGTRVNIAVGGDGFISGLTTFSIPSEKVRRVSEISYGSTHAWATFEIDSDLPSSVLSIIVRTGSETAALTGAVRVREAEETPRRRGSARG